VQSQYQVEKTAQKRSFCLNGFPLGTDVAKSIPCYSYGREKKALAPNKMLIDQEE
jgi:hypothetical protein